MAKRVTLMFLLDTCTYLWLTTQPSKLSSKAKAVLSKNTDVFISAISSFEIGTKVNRNLIEFPMPFEKWWQRAVELHGLSEQPIDSDIAMLASQLPPIHNDPVDRLIIATAMKYNLSIITPDSHICEYPNIKIIW